MSGGARKDPGYPAAQQVAAALRVGGMLAMSIDSSDVVAVAVASTGYVTLRVSGLWLGDESSGARLAEVDEVVTALNAGGFYAVRYFGPNSDTTYVNSIIAEDATGANSIAVSLGWPPTPA